MASKRIFEVKKTFQSKETKLSVDEALYLFSNYLTQEIELRNKTKIPYKAKFDETLSIEFELGIDGKRSDQMVKSFVSLPFGHGKKTKVIVVTDSSQLSNLSKESFLVGGRELLQEIASGKINLKQYSSCFTFEGMMKEIASSGCSKVLGMAGIMPNLKNGTILKTNEILESSLENIVLNNIEIKSDKFGYLKCSIGKSRFALSDLKSNIIEVSDKIKQLKPASSSGIFIKNTTLSSTMGFMCRISL